MIYWKKLKNYEPKIEEYQKGKQTRTEIADIFTFDIETTSIWNIDGNITTYKDCYTEKQYNKSEKKAFCYIWQFGINDTIYFGRYIEDFVQFITYVTKNINTTEKPIIWVHNLSYEFQFLREYLEIYDNINMFARTERKPIKFDWNGLEFRCTYFLTRKSLAVWGDELGIPKMVGDLDYTKLRTPLTPMTKKELGYCERDCIVVYKGILEFLKTYEHQSNIPLTQTGRVRREVKALSKGDTFFLRKVTSMQPHNEEEYKLLRAVFAGGSCGSNYLNSNKILTNVGSHDLTSDYPYQLVAEKFPMCRFREISVHKKRNYDKYSYIFTIEMENVKSKTCLHYLPSSKCHLLNGAKIDNGKVISANKIVYTCTEQDRHILKECYEYDETIVKVFQSRKQYLPTFFVSYVLKLYHNKSTMKGLEEFIDQYKESKEFINALYGMCVMDIVQPDITYDMEWDTEQPNIPEQIEDMLKKFYNNFVAYIWGCWVTAYARRMLWDVLLHELKEDHVYHDTDSCKYINPEKHELFFDLQNREIELKLRKAMEWHDLPFDLCKPKDYKGIPHLLGAWDKERTYKSFKTLGAKKYAYTYDTEDCIHCTISGVPKNNAIALKSLEDFREDFVFPRDLTDENGIPIAKNLVQYVDNSDWSPTLPDGYVADNKHSTVIRPTTYAISLSSDYSHLLNLGKNKNQL